MNAKPLQERIAEHVAKLPPGMRKLLNLQLAAGNRVTDVEVGRGKEKGCVAIILDHPFRLVMEKPPKGIMYHELKNRDPMVFEFYTTDKKWSLCTAKFKPMVLQTAHGPPDPMPAHLERMRKVREREEAEAARRAQETQKNPVDESDSNLADASNKFLASMKMTFDMWHDGTGYDLAALDQVPANQLPAIECRLLNHHPVDWRDIEALARLDSPAARAAVVAALKHSDPKVRREAMHHAAAEADPADREKHLLLGLQSDDVFAGLSEAIDEAEQFHPPAVMDALLRGALNRPGQTAVLFAGLLYFIHGKSKAAFDWDHRPFFLRFDTSDRADREAVFRELCATIGIDPGKYRCSVESAQRGTGPE